MNPSQKPILRGFLSGRTEDRDVVDFHAEVAAAKRAMPSFEIDGTDVSRALRAIGFNRDYAATRGLTYRRTVK